MNQIGLPYSRIFPEIELLTDFTESIDAEPYSANQRSDDSTGLLAQTGCQCDHKDRAQAHDHKLVLNRSFCCASLHLGNLLRTTYAKDSISTKIQ